MTVNEAVQQETDPESNMRLDPQSLEPFGNKSSARVKVVSVVRVKGSDAKRP